MAPQLPADVVRLILDDVDDLELEDVCCASHVSQSWRLAARCHSVFSRDISIMSDERGPSTGTVHLFLDRLGARPGYDLHLVFRLGSFWKAPKRGGADRVRQSVIPALRQSLTRLVRLTVECDECLLSDFTAALCVGPAPRLKEFKFLVPTRSESHERPTLPLDVFAGCAPQLLTLRMDAFQFPESAVPAFATVRSLTCIVCSETGSPDLHPERFFVSCPALHELFISCRELDEEDWSLCPSPSTTHLRHLTVSAAERPECTDPVVRALSHAHTASIDVPLGLVEAGTADFLLGHLDDSAALELDLSRAFKMCSWHDRVPSLSCTVIDAVHKRRRCFTHFIDEFMRELEGSLQPGVDASFRRIAPRITSISHPDAEIAWDCLALLFLDADLSGVQTVTVIVGERLGLFTGLEGYPEDAPSLPSLTKVRLVANKEGIVDVRQKALAHVVDTMWRVPDARTLEVELVRVSLIDNKAPLANRFKIVGTTH